MCIYSLTEPSKTLAFTHHRDEGMHRVYQGEDMVGLVIVSHSRQLAEAACRLAKGVGEQDLPIVFAGGAGDSHQELGTDATDIMDAINQVNAGDGVVVLMDLGSAVLSARLAEQMLGDDVPDIRLCPAPLVEGAVAAAVQIGIGATLDTVCCEAQNALQAKLQEVSDADGQSDETAAAQKMLEPDTIPAGARLFRFTMDDPNGMHTRPAAEFVKAIHAFPSEVRIRNLSTNGNFVNGRSLNKIALSNIRKGDISEVAIWGEQTDETCAALRSLVISTYHGNEVTDIPTSTETVPALTSAPAAAALAQLSPGIAVGTLYIEDENNTLLQPIHTENSEAEIERLEKAIGVVDGNLSAQSNRPDPGHDKQAAILAAQRLILGDSEVLEEIKSAIRASKQDAASIYQNKMQTLAASYRALDDAYMRERATDVSGVAAQVLRELQGSISADISQLKDVVLWAKELSPAHIGRWQPEQIAALLTQEGGLTSHVAILAKSMNIPAIMGYSLPTGAASGQTAAVDANSLEIQINPDDDTATGFRERRDNWRKQLEQDLEDSRGKAVTHDNVHIPILANVGDPASVEAAVTNNAEGVGLLRTEFMFLDRRQPPTEEEQTRELTALLRPFASSPVTVRTLDAGADKVMPWLPMKAEANPFLGVRGVRLVIRNPDLLKTQLRAILKAGSAAGVNDVRIMIPMIATIDEIDFARQALNDAHAELETEGQKHSWPVQFGIMVETPAAVFQAEAFASRVDFFSIGTNDLTQYVMCAERGSQELAELSNGLHPAVLTAIAMVVAGAAVHGTEVAVCGEMAGDPLSALALIGLGVHHLSMSASAIGRVKRTIRHISRAELSEAARKALTAKTANEVASIFSDLAS